MSQTRTIKLDTLARLEGEGSLYVRFSGSHVSDVKLRIPEPPRLFEGILEGRSYDELPDIVARICGICPIAHQMASVHAVEQAFNVAIHPSVRALRRLFYCGEWIESHALHIYLLHAPDYLGYADVIGLARDHKPRVEAGLKLKKTGNDLMAVMGGREIHPVSACAGGFYRVPTVAELRKMREPLQEARDLAVETVRFVAGFEFPDFEQNYEFVALSHPDEYAINEGRVISSGGLDIAVEAYLDHFVERQVAHSHALHSAIRGRGSYLVGPLARFNLNFGRLPGSVRELAKEAGVMPPCRNPFRGIVVRAIETVFACEESLRIIDEYEPPQAPCADFKPQAGVGQACTEAPRGLLFHRYEFDDSGTILSARIIPPTAQCLKRMEEDLYFLVGQMASLTTPELTHRCEQAIRNYDPCISCATHFLDVTVERD
ncbi:MAG TPA: Ni/Fe hydrogenase subunit alpha [Bryobacteraceae bacterium]|nr:Ni/Fe hydrogenase subunit alpha [Bryobacteraceae bacterium]